MKNRLHDKKAGIAILVSIIVIALTEIVFRIIFYKESLHEIASYNLGEQITVIFLASIILFFGAKGKDRICYLCFTAWIGYFVIDQMFQVPKVIMDVIPFTSEGLNTSTLVPIFYLVSLLCIIVLGALLVEYMNDGSIYNRAFNGFSIVAILTIIASIIVNVIVVINSKNMIVLLSSFHNLYRLAMVFLFAFFAYDSAKKQLSKVDFSSES